MARRSAREQISLELDRAVFESLASALRPNGNGSEKSEAVAAFAQIALNELASWSAGTERHRTLTELYISRVEQLYVMLFPGEMPRATVLFNRSNLPHGQATYIARVLTEKELPLWRAKARLELRHGMEEQRQEAEANIE